MLTEHESGKGYVALYCRVLHCTGAGIRDEGLILRAVLGLIITKGATGFEESGIWRQTLMVLLVIAAVTLAGCGGKPADTDSQADGKPIDIIVSHNYPENSPEHEGMAAFKELVEKD